MSCLFGETGASIMGVQEPLASKGMLDAITAIQYLDGLEAHGYLNGPSWENSMVDLCRHFLSSFTPNGKHNLSFNVSALIFPSFFAMQGVGMIAQLDML